MTGTYSIPHLGQISGHLAGDTLGRLTAMNGYGPCRYAHLFLRLTDPVCMNCLLYACPDSPNTLKMGHRFFATVSGRMSQHQCYSCNCNMFGTIWGSARPEVVSPHLNWLVDASRRNLHG